MDLSWVPVPAAALSAPVADADCLSHLDRWAPFSGFSQLLSHVAGNVSEVLLVNGPADGGAET